MAIAQELKRLLDERDYSPELCFVAGNCSYPRRRLLKDKCKIHHDGTISIVARIAGASFCPHSEEHFYFSLARELMSMEGKRITVLVVGYPSWEVSTMIENTHLGTRVIFGPDGRRMAG
jgi:hypothetical protein